jgi:hypothetical protein
LGGRPLRFTTSSNDFAEAAICMNWRCSLNDHRITEQSFGFAFSSTSRRMA